MCLYFSFYSLEIILDIIFKNNSISNIIYNTDIINNTDIIEWFKSYLILDIFYMMWNKSKRWDLYIHHIWSLINYYNCYNCYNFFHIFVLINESISIVSGLDSYALENKDFLLSKKYKKIRINIINYIRRPIWIITIFFILYYKSSINIFIFYQSLLTCICMLLLDYYWYKKCLKIINL